MRDILRRLEGESDIDRVVLCGTALAHVRRIGPDAVPRWDPGDGDGLGSDVLATLCAAVRGAARPAATTAMWEASIDLDGAWMVNAFGGPGIGAADAPQECDMTAVFERRGAVRPAHRLGPSARLVPNRLICGVHGSGTSTRLARDVSSLPRDLRVVTVEPGRALCVPHSNRTHLVVPPPAAQREPGWVCTARCAGEIIHLSRADLVILTGLDQGLARLAGAVVLQSGARLWAEMVVADSADDPYRRWMAAADACESSLPRPDLNALMRHRFELVRLAP